MVAAALQAAFGSGGLHALPTGGQVVIPGSAQIGAPVNNALTITNAPGAIINWQSFSIAPNELVRFVQQNAASAVLNRVTGSQMSEIMGRLQSNGRVFLVNPNGIVVGPGAVIDTAAFIGSTLPMLDRDFIDGRLRFQGDASSNGRIVNQGSIRTGFGGQVMLVSPNIENTGLIEAPGGQILLAAGKSVTITSLNASGVSFELQAPTDSVVNIGQLLADGGVVRAFAGSLRHSGDIRANSLVRDAGGQIVLQGSREATLAAGSSTRADGGTGGSVQVDSAGTTRVEGSVSATGSSGAGGRVEITGDRVVLAGNATADASGATGGGTVLVGGDWQGGNAAVRNASSTFVGSGVTLKADATVNGNGGTIVAWADGNTRFLGTLSARGGAQGGDGGRAEVSGRGDLLFIGGADLGAPLGRAGSLLLDPLDLFIDTAGGLNPNIIDETTDFPDNAVTVSPGTLAAITGNVTLYASRDMRFNSNVTLTGAGQSLTAQAGRDLQLGSTITTSNGAVSLNAGRAITTFGSPSIAAGTGAVSAVSANGGLALGAVSSAGSLAASATNGNLNLGAVTASGAVSLTTVNGSVATGNITTTGPIAINSAASISGGTYTSGGSAVTLAAAGSVSTSGITTAGGSITASAATSIVSLGTLSTIAGSGPNGGALTVSAPQSTASTGNWTGGNGNAVLGGTSVNTGTLNTTGNVTLTATSGNVNATIDNAASVVATSSRSFSSTSISLSSNTVLNANSVTATATDCSFSSSCPGASITLSGALGVNVGTVTANAPVTFRSDRTAEYQSRSRSIDINGGNGPINAMGAGSQVTATDVTLRTTAGGGGGIGVAGTPLRVDVERSFTFRPNGGFDVLLNGSGPIVFDARLGVAATGNTYTGALSMPGAITLNASATDSTVTVSNFSVVAGFDRPVYSSTPSIALQTPNGALAVTSAAAPAGDNTGFAVCPPGFGSCSNPSILSLPVSFSASGALTVNNYIRAAGTSGKSTSFTAGNGGIGALVLGTINGNRDAISAIGDDSVTVNDLSTLGSVSVSSTVGSTVSGNVTIGRIGSGSSSVSVTANNGTIAALNDGVANEITSGSNVTLSAASIGTAGFANPLDLAGNSISLSATGSAAGTGYIGSGPVPTNPVVAATQQLTVNASRQFNVDTGTTPVVNLTVTATPAGVGAGGLARVRSDGQPFVFGSDGSKFTLSNLSTTTQLNGGTLSFTSTAGSIDFGNIDFSATNGGLTLRTQQNATGDVTRVAGPVNLGSGRLAVQADRDVNLGDLTVGGLSVSSVNGSFPGPGACETIGFSFVCATNTLTVGDITGGSFGGTFSATTRRAISVGVLDGVGTVSFSAYSGGISTSTIGSGAAPASSVSLRTDQTSAGGNIVTGAIDAGTINLNATGTATTGALNAAATTGGSFTNVSATGAVNTGTINAAAAAPGQVLLRSNTSVTAGTIATSSLSVGSYTTFSSPTINLGAISGPSDVSVQGGSVTLGAIAMDAASAGSLSINASGTLTLGGAITAGDGTNATINAGNTGPLLFSRIDTGDNGRVSISSANGIEQTQVAAGGGGIRAGTVLLSANGGSGSILGPGADNARLTLRNTTNLTLTIGNDSRLSLVDGAGSAPGPELVNLDITRSRNDSTFVLDGLSPTQTLALVDTGGGTRITLNSGGSAAPLNFRYRNDDSAGVIEVTSINSNGGSVALDAPNGDVRVTTINAAGAGVDRLVSISSGGRVDVAGVIDGGNSPVNISAAQAVRRTAVGGEVRSNTSVGITAAGTNAIGASPTNERFRITAPSVNLDGGEIYADLTGTTSLTAQVTNALSVTSGTDLASLNLSIDATGTGATSIATATQTFGLARNAGELEIGAIDSATPLGNLQITTTTGGMQVIGTGASSISADSLRLQSAGRLYIDGVGARAVLSNGDQQFLASGELKVEGQAALNATGNQSFTTFGANDIVFTASGGAIGVTAGTQSLSASRDILLLGGSATGDAVTLASTSGAQTLSASRSIALTAGTGAGSSVTLDSSGSGQQLLQALTSITLTGGGTSGGSEAASVSVLQSGFGGQRLQARTSIVLTGGIGDDGTVLVHNSGTGTQSIGDPFPCCNTYRTDTVTLQGGAGSGSSVELRSTTGQQRVEPFNALNVNGGTGNGAHARIASTSSNEQVIGGPNYFCCNYDPINTIAIAAGSGTNAFAEITATSTQRVTSVTSLAMTGSAASGAYSLISGAGQDIRTAATSLVAGTGNGADAQILSTGTASQFIDPTSLTMTAGGLAGAHSASARIVSGGTQTFGFTGPTVLTGGAGPNSVAEIRSAGTQNLSLGNLTLTGGTDVQSWAKITSGGSQSVSASTTLLSGGTGAGTVAQIDAASNQNFSAGNTTLVGGSGVAGAGNSSGALITNASGNQSMSTGALTVRSGATYAPTGIINNGANQTISAGSIQVGTSAGANAVDNPIAGTFHSAIAQQGTGGQTVNASSLTIDNVHSAGSVGVANRGAGVQTVTVSGALNVLASGGGGIATLDSGNVGMQTVTANGGIIVRASAGGGLAQIANPLGSQTFASSGGGVQIQATGGSGSAKISASGAQTFTAVRSLEVVTTSAATGNAELVAGGDQSIHTTNGTVAGHSVKVVALGTGTAKIEAGGNQLIEADYPELMQAVRDGRIFIGDAAALGPSLIKATNQDIFARSITIQGGSTGAATAKLDASGNQTISILTPSALPSGITVAGGAGGSASLDPLVQTILSNGPIQVLGGSGNNAFALIQSSGPQTILVTGPATPNSVLIQGGSGNNAYAAITTPDPAMALGTTGGISLVGGTGANADAVFGNGAVNIVNFSCGTAFTCTFTNLAVDPFLNPGVDVGIANNGVQVPLSSILAPTGGPTASQTGNSLPFDFGNLLLALRDQSDQTLEGDAEQEMLVMLLGRRLPLCR